MKSMTALRLGARNFSRNIYRYRFLSLAMLFVVASFTFIVGAISGMTAALEAKASRYFSGQLTIQQVFRYSYSKVEQPVMVIEYLRRAIGIGPQFTMRSIYYNAGQAELFFGGRSQRQRRLIGVDWAAESDFLGELEFREGGAPSIYDSQAILVSTITAETLQLSLGDEVVVRLVTDSGSLNSGIYVVRGIYHETSFFGFSSYLQRGELNKLMAVDEESVMEIGIFLKRGADAQKIGLLLTQALSEIGPCFPLFVSRSQRDEALSSGVAWVDSQFLVMTLHAQLAEISNLLAALRIIGTLILALFAGLVVIGVSNTYSFLVLERTAEIGTMRAMGMQKNMVIGLFLSESLCLGLSGSLIGLVGGVALLDLASKGLDLSGLGLASMFLVRGRLYWLLEPIHVVLIGVLSLLSILAGSFSAALKASRLPPADALRKAH